MSVSRFFRPWYVAVTPVLLSAMVLYFAVAAYSLRFGLSRILFPSTPHSDVAPAAATDRVKGSSANELLVRRYGGGSVGCVVFFPGQHGAATAYDFSRYVSAGLTVLSLAYPGQDGAHGHAELGEVESLVIQGIAAVSDVCPSDRTVFVGVSLGAMLAAYTSRSVRLAGVVLLSTAPSLSSAIRVRLRSRFYLAPLSMLPLSALLPCDYSLADSIGRTPDLRVVIFQGTDDEQTPIGLLRSVAPARGWRLIEVPGATHSTTFALSQAAQVAVILGMLASH